MDAVSTLFNLLTPVALPAAVLLDAPIPLAAALLGDRGTSLTASAGTDKVVESAATSALTTVLGALGFLSRGLKTGMRTSETISLLANDFAFGFVGDSDDDVVDGGDSSWACVLPSAETGCCGFLEASAPLPLLARFCAFGVEESAAETVGSDPVGIPHDRGCWSIGQSERPHSGSTCSVSLTFRCTSVLGRPVGGYSHSLTEE